MTANNIMMSNSWFLSCFIISLIWVMPVSAQDVTLAETQAVGSLPVAQNDLTGIKEKIQQLQPEYQRLQEENNLLQKEHDNLSERLIIVTKRIRASEEHITALEEDIKALDAREKILASGLQSRKSETAKVLSAIGRLSLAPSSPLGAVEDETKTMQTAIILRSLTKSLKQKADKLSSDIKQLSDMREALRTQRTALSENKLALDADSQELKKLLIERQKRIAENDTGLSEKKAYIEKLSTQEKNITSLIDQIQRQDTMLLQKRRLELVQTEKTLNSQEDNPFIDDDNRDSVETASLGQGTKLPPKNTPSGVMSAQNFNTEKGRLLTPVVGQMIYGYGAKDMTGKMRQGLTIRTKAAGIVTSPSSGEVIYVGKFRDYGYMVIVKPTEDYHILVAGLGSTDVSLGQKLMKGEPVGSMPKGAGDKNLYLEMRRQKQPIDPAPWLMNHTQMANKNN